MVTSRRQSGVACIAGLLKRILLAYTDEVPHNAAVACCVEAQQIDFTDNMFSRRRQVK